MRRGTWLLAISGAMTLHTGGISAADPFAPPSGPIPTRYTRPAPPPTKNYYDALFGTPDTTPSEPTPTAAAPAADAQANAPAAPKPAKAAAAPFPAEEIFQSAQSPRIPAKRPESAPPLKRGAAGSTSKAAPTAAAPKVIPASSEAPAANDKKVIQATFEKSPNESERNYIQPVRANVDAPKTAASASKAADTGAACPNVALEWSKRSELNVGKECKLELVVKNTGTATATQVTVEAAFPSTVRLTASEPKPANSIEKLAWTFDALPAGTEKRIAISLVPSTRGELGANATVRFTGQALATFKVEEPLLKLDVKGAHEVQIGDPAPQIITITNPGTGVAHDVKIHADISEGLEHRLGPKSELTIGSLAPGESRQVRLGLSAVKGGAQTVALLATSSCEASCEANIKIAVIAPSLQVALHGPGMRYKGRSAKYTVTVTNDGTVPNSNVRVTHKIPDGFQFVAADRGKFDSAEKCVHWYLGRMEAGQTVQLNCELMPNALGDFKHLVTVDSDSGVHSQTHLATRVEGLASLDAEIVDLDDPVELGSEAAWEIRVKNSGSKAATNITVTCDVPAGVELLAARGPTGSTTAAKTVTFKSLSQLGPGQQAIYRVHVRGVTEGAHRLRAHVSSDTLDQPLSMEEATRFYSDAKN